MRALATLVAFTALLIAAGCEKSPSGANDKEELRKLAIKFLTAKTYDDWASCLDGDSQETLDEMVGGKFTKEMWAKTPRPTFKKEDIEVAEIEISGDAAIVHVRSKTGQVLDSSVAKHWATRKEGKWLFTWGKPTAPVHKADMGRARERARRIKCKKINLGCIGKALAEFKEKHGKWPDTLDEIVGEELGWVGERELKCPSALEREAGYVLIPVPESESGRAPVVAEHLSNHKEGGHVLYTDGKVEWKDAEELTKILQISGPAGER